MLDVRANIKRLPLPPKTPELNPPDGDCRQSPDSQWVENVWQFRRDDRLSNVSFASCDDIVDRCCRVWNKLIDQPQRITSIGLRQSAHGSRSMGYGIKGLRRLNDQTTLTA